jgi:hypothetical protein
MVITKSQRRNHERHHRGIKHKRRTVLLSETKGRQSLSTHLVISHPTTNNVCDFEKQRLVIDKTAVHYIVKALRYAGMPSFVHRRGRDHKHIYRNWDVKKLRIHKLPSPKEQTVALQNTIKENPESKVVCMIKHASSDGNPWREVAFFRGMYGLCKSEEGHNIYHHAKIFFDHCHPKISIGHSQSIDCRTNTESNKKQCRVNPFHVSTYKYTQFNKKKVNDAPR